MAFAVCFVFFCFLLFSFRFLFVFFCILSLNFLLLCSIHLFVSRRLYDAERISFSFQSIDFCLFLRLDHIASSVFAICHNPAQDTDTLTSGTYQLKIIRNTHHLYHCALQGRFSDELQVIGCVKKAG